jgi:Flp pilus assembly protein TadG
MIGKNVSRLRQHSESGQTLVLVPLLLVVLLIMGALVLDLGNVYVCYQQLQSTTSAAAMAGGAAIPQGTATTAVNQYSGSSTTSAIYNVHSNLNITSVTTNLACVSLTTYPNLGLPPCSVYGAQASANVIQVTEKASVPTYFAKLFGVKTVPISATATASAKGGGAPPYDIMLVMDSTASMGTGQDTGCVVGAGGSYSPEQCAEYGVQTLLKELDPCATTLASCPTGGSGLGTGAVDEVGMMTFPGLCSDSATGVTTTNCPVLPATGTLTNTTANPTYAPDDYACPAKNPPIAQYNNDPEYLILGFQNNYRGSDISVLNTGSNLYETVNAGTNNCGIQTPGGEGTFYAGAIVAAQQYLAANARQGAQDVIILLSDGDATASATQMGGNVKQSVTVTDMTNGLFSASNECTQAVAAANWAKTTIPAPGIAPTVIYSISYGSETSGCSTGEGLTPCQTMSGISSLPLSQYFFSVPQTVGGKTSTVCSGAVSITQLSQVFTTIAGNLTTSRLVPNIVF